MRAIDFYFDFLSPYSYLAHSQLGTLDAPVRVIPISVLEVMKIVNNTPTTLICGAKRSYAGKDLARWAARYGLPMGRPDMRRVDGGLLLRLATAAESKDIAGDVTSAIFNAVWSGVGDASPAAISAVLSEKRLPAAELMTLAEKEETAQALTAATAEAASRGVFGTPTFRIGDDLYFGNDRLDFVREALASQRKDI